MSGPRDAARIPLRVAVDVTPMIGPRTGIGQFTAGLVTALDDRCDVEVTRFAVTIRGRRTAAIDSRPIPARAVTRLWGQADHPRLDRFLRNPVEVVHGTNYLVPPTGAAALVSVHDLTMVRYPELCRPETLRFAALVRRAVSRGAAVHADSVFVADEIRTWLPAADVHVVHPGIHAPGPATPRRPSGPPWIVAVGTIEPRKDYPTLLRAFGELAGSTDRRELRLVIVGQPGWGVDAFEAALSVLPEAARSRVDRRGYVADDERDRLLDGAAAFVYPSRYEGFGIAPLEAMARGVPVVATRAGSLPEVLGDAALLVDVGDASALAAALESVLDNPSPWTDRGRVWVEKYRWNDAAEAMASLYRHLAERRSASWRSRPLRVSARSRHEARA